MRPEKPLSQPSSWGICPLGLVPVRKEAGDRFEMVNQLIFGELYQLLETDAEGKWYKIMSTRDGYKGWIDAQQHLDLSLEAYERLLSQPRFSTREFSALVKGDSTQFWIPYGAELPYFQEGAFQVGGQSYTLEAQCQVNQTFPNYTSFLAHAFTYLHSPYLWGGRSAWGCDCSGFTQHLFQLAGQKLPRDAYQQVEEGVKVSNLGECQGGELAFFAREGRIVHVGLVLVPRGIPWALRPLKAHYYILHALGKVRVDVLDAEGIYHQEKHYYTHRLARIRQWEGLFLA